MDLSSGGRLCIPTVDSQLVGRQGLDLNAGPDVEGRDETLRCLSKPMSNMGPLALQNKQTSLYSMEGGVLKRKEPDGVSDSKRLSFKQHSCLPGMSRSSCYPVNC